MLNRWKSLEKKELKLMLVHPPENVFEEMIQWTEKGILWKFPINNEIGNLYSLHKLVYFYLI